MARKRKLEQSPTTGPNATDDVSRDVLAAEAPVSRRKKSAATRIGRACDRCQHRKLACDPAPEGCPACLRVDTWCTATDPLTGNPTYRGEFEYLERTAAKQRAQIAELLARLRALGEDGRPYQDEDPGTQKYFDWVEEKAKGNTRPWDRDERRPSNSAYYIGSEHAQSGNADYCNTDVVPTTESSLPLHTSSHNALSLPDLRTGLAGENYLGVSANNPSLSSTRGSKLNLLGWEINLSGFTSADSDDLNQSYGLEAPSYDRSYRSFIATAFGVSSKIDAVHLPPKEEGYRQASGYLHVLNAFLPILHQPSFMNLLARFYDDDDFHPCAAEEVIVHMVFASMFYQDALRNWEDLSRQQDLHAAANMHYHYSLGLFAQLMAGHTLQDVQALALICAHVRTFPKPEAGWVAISMAFSKAIELGLHRAFKANTPSAKQKNVLELEMRKRTFWCVLTLHVTISGKLGRPMPVREDDYDAGIPLAVDDSLLSETGMDTTSNGNCGFLIGIEAFKLIPIFMDMYRTLYAAKRLAKDYTQFVITAEKRIKTWQEGWPTRIHKDSQLNLMFTEYLHLFLHEFRLVLHHPSLSLTKSIQFNDSNLRTCMSICRDMLKHVKGLQQLKSLDTTWQSCAVYILAIQTALYGHGQLKNELTAEKLESLKIDMEQWLSIMGDIGGLLGTGRRFTSALREQIDIGLRQLEEHIVSTKNASVPTKLKRESVSQNEDSCNGQVGLVQQDNFQGSNGYGSYAESGQLHGYDHHNDLPPQATDQQAHNIYSSMPAYAYPEPSAVQYPSSTAISSSYAASPYPVNLATQALSSAYQPQLNPGPSTSINGIYAPTVHGYDHNNTYGPDSQSWFQYTQTIPMGIGPQDYNPASALLQLGGRAEPMVNRVNSRGVDIGGGYDTSAMSGGAGTMWPNNIFGQNNGGT